MADDILKNIPLPADLPENWTSGQIIAPTGAEAGLDEQHGYNYLMKQVNNAQKALKALAAQREKDLARIKFWVSNDPTSPASFIGGTWEQIKDRFILAAGDTYAAGNEGGSATHDHETKLFHSWYAGNVNGYAGFSVMPYNYRTKDWANGVQNGTHYSLANNAMIETSSEKISAKYEATGTVSESSTMPPYTTKYVWQRIE